MIIQEKIVIFKKQIKMKQTSSSLAQQLVNHLQTKIAEFKHDLTVLRRYWRIRNRHFSQDDDDMTDELPLIILVKIVKKQGFVYIDAYSNISAWKSSKETNRRLF